MKAMILVPLLLCPASLNAQEDAAYRLVWPPIASLRFTYEARDTMAVEGSGRRMLMAYHRVLSLSGMPCVADSACTTIAASFERDFHEMSQDSGRTFGAVGNVGTGDTTLIGLAPDGEWKEVRSGSRVAAGYTVEALQAFSGLRLPAHLVRIGDEWPVESAFRRMTAPFGEIRAFYRGRATLDSVCGTRAWITLTGVDSSASRAGSMVDSTRTTITWDLEQGGLLEAVTESTVRTVGVQPPSVIHRRGSVRRVSSSERPRVAS